MPPRIESPFRPARPALIEPIVQPLYSSVIILAAAPAAQLQFFQVPQGAVGFNPVLTNMELAGTLANPKIFVIRGMRLHIAQNVAVVDAAATMVNFVALLQIIESYWYRLQVGTKEYLRAPAFYLASGLGAWLQNAAEGATAAANTFYTGTIGVPQHENYFKVSRRPIVIPPQQSFVAELNLGPALAALTGGIDRRVWNFLEGDLGREVM
jgi:hypothetical protein